MAAGSAFGLLDAIPEGIGSWVAVAVLAVVLLRALVRVVKARITLAIGSQLAHPRGSGPISWFVTNKILAAKNVFAEEEAVAALRAKLVAAPRGGGEQGHGGDEAAQRPGAAEAGASQAASSTPATAVLEVGFGTGIGLRAALNEVEGGDPPAWVRVVGVEVSDKMIATVLSDARLSAAVDAGLVTVLHASAAALPFADGHFAGIFHSNVAYFWEDVPGTLAELQRVLRPGGVMVSVGKYDLFQHLPSGTALEHPSFRNVEKRDYVAALKAAGFVDVRAEERAEGPGDPNKASVYQRITVVFATKPLGDSRTSAGDSSAGGATVSDTGARRRGRGRADDD